MREAVRAGPRHSFENHFRGEEVNEDQPGNFFAYLRHRANQRHEEKGTWECQMGVKKWLVMFLFRQATFSRLGGCAADHNHDGNGSRRWAIIWPDKDLTPGSGKKAGWARLRSELPDS